MKLNVAMFVFLVIISPWGSGFTEGQEESFQAPKIGMVTISTPDRICFAEYSLKSFREYAGEKGYGFHFFDKVFAPDRLPEWSKIRAVQTVLETDKYDWVAWFDDDIFITNPSTRLESFINEAGTNVDFIIGEDITPRRDPVLYVNSGLFLVKNTEWARDFLRQVWDIGYTRYTTERPGLEQAAIGELLLGNYDKSPHVKIFPMKRLQSYMLTLTRGGLDKLTHKSQWEPGDFAAHMAGENNCFRMCYMQQLSRNSFVFPSLPAPFRNILTPNPSDSVTAREIMIVTTDSSAREESLNAYIKRWGYRFYDYSEESFLGVTGRLLGLCGRSKNSWIAFCEDILPIKSLTTPLEMFIQEHQDTADWIFLGASENSRGILLMKDSPDTFAHLQRLSAQSLSGSCNKVSDLIASLQADKSPRFTCISPERAHEFFKLPGSISAT